MQRFAVIFDFDDTLVPDSTSQFLDAHGIDPDDFFQSKAHPLLREGYDHTLAYMNRLLQLVGEDQPLGELTHRDLQKFGSSLDETTYEGVPDVFERLQNTVADEAGVYLEFYLISSGKKVSSKGRN